MALYEMLREDGTPFLDGACGLYNARSAFHGFGATLSDDDARSRGLIDADGFPADGWIWYPGPVS